MWFVLLFLICSIILVFKTCSPEDNITYSSSYNSYIKSSQKFEEPSKLFQKAKKELLETIKEDLDNSENILRKKVLESLLRRPILDEDDLVKLDFLYNDGNLRNDEEASYMERYFNTKRKRENFNEERHKVNTIAFIVPFTTVTIIMCIVISKSFFFPLYLIIALVPGLVAGLIGSIIGYSTNIRNAKEYCISDDDPRLKEEILKRKAAIAAGITSSIIIGHHAKKDLKELTNVESWSEMK